MTNSLSKLNEELTETQKKLDKALEVIYGNGDFSKGLCSKVQKNEESIIGLAKVVKSHWVLFLMILGTMIGMFFK